VESTVFYVSSRDVKTYRTWLMIDTMSLPLLPIPTPQRTVDTGTRLMLCISSVPTSLGLVSNIDPLEHQIWTRRMLHMIVSLNPKDRVRADTQTHTLLTDGMQYTTATCDLKSHSDRTLSDLRYPSTSLSGIDLESPPSQRTDLTWTHSRPPLRTASVRSTKLDSTSACLSTAESIS